MGMVAMPVTGRLFSHFKDKGWLFSKVFAVCVSGFLTWFLVAAGVFPFTSAVCIGVSVVCGVFCMVLFNRQQKAGIECYPVQEMKLVVREELLFFAVFLMWTYLAGFHPQAYGTEKFMDYGFMEAMMRSDVLPARDLWYSEGHINYYYGGQYFAVFLTKLTGSQVELTYNLMRTFVAAFAFVLPFSLAYQMSVDRLKKNIFGKKRYIPAADSAPVLCQIFDWSDGCTGPEPYEIQTNCSPPIRSYRPSGGRGMKTFSFSCSFASFSASLISFS